MTITLVTGGSGMVGRNIRAIVESESRAIVESESRAIVESESRAIVESESLESAWIFVSSRDYNLLNEQEADRMIKTYKPDVVIHLAAKVGGLYDNMAHNATFLRDNVLINFNVFEACRKFGVKKVVSCLSTCIFPDEIDLPISEGDLHKGPPHHSNYGYSYAKRLLEVMSRAYNESEGLRRSEGSNEEFKSEGPRFVTVIPTNIFGKHDNFDLERGHVIPALIHKCYLAKRDNSPFYIRGDGSAMRQFIYAEDLAKLFIWAAKNYNDNQPLILAPKEEHTIRDVVDTIVEIFDFKGPVIYDSTFSNGQMRKEVSNKKLVDMYPEFQFTQLKDALTETIGWFAESINKHEFCKNFLRGISKNVF
jgi:GDP-L-fucose synthase